jgi:glyceraldehyde 3-phosphate dehydrogenase
VVIRAAFNWNKVNNCALKVPFMVYMLQYESIHGKFNGTVKGENGKFVINGKSPLVSSLPWRRLGFT